eukprot:GHUV01037785.1.p1 GENE.GHUV01037785.1~~GHUV01037785.1.p1  ORF type:complete len:215 (-),score=49.81 GHUV01037785.1:484-1128(-)
MAALQRIDTHCISSKDIVGGASEEPEGASPTASASSSLEGIEYYTGQLGSNQHCVQLHRPRRRGALSWVVRSLYRLQGKQRDQADDYLPSGGSYESLISLDGSSPLSTSQRQHHQFQQQQQHEPKQPFCNQEQLPCLGLDAEIASSVDVEPQLAEGIFRRMAKAVLRPIVRLVSSVVAHAGPQGPGTNDNSTAERIINVITSIPFCVIGAYGLR